MRHTKFSEHVLPGGHAALQRPQLESLCALTQAPLQHWPKTPCAKGHIVPSFEAVHVGVAWHAPLAQNSLARHAMPQRPQCCADVLRSMHVPPQHSPVAKAPQSWPSFAPVQSFRTHRSLRQVEPGPQLC